MLYAVPLNRVTLPAAGQFLLAFAVASNPLGSTTTRVGVMRRRARHLMLTPEGDWQPTPQKRVRMRRRRRGIPNLVQAAPPYQRPCCAFLRGFARRARR